MLKVLSCITQQHDLRLVALSAVICALGCFTTLTLLARAQETRGRAAARSVVVSGLVFGCSVWALHFVAMLAFMPDQTMSFEISLTLVSVLVAAGGSWAAFRVWRSRKPFVVRAGVGGLLLGASISGMHYLGVLAMRFAGFVLFDTTYLVCSIAASAVLATVAFARGRGRLTMKRRLECTAWLSLAICAMHFTGMTGMTMAPGAAMQTGSVVLGNASLAVIVAGVSLVILIASLAAVLMERHLSARTVRELARMRLMSNLAHEGLLIHRDGIILEVNNAGERLFKRDVQDLIGQPLLDLFGDASRPAVLRQLRCTPDVLLPEELEILTADGAGLPVEFTCQRIDYMGKPATAVALRDLTDRKRDEERIRYLARHDALTNLPNRYNLHERLDTALETAARQGSRLAILYMDLDRFKPVNDIYGHAAGDKLLMECARRILASLEPADTLARIGGDEFVMVIASETQPEKLAALARQLIETVREPVTVDGHRVDIGASIGIALFPDDGTTADTLLRAADTAMYRVKEEGRGSLCFFEPAMDAQLQARRQLEHELSGAVRNGEMVLYYQPIVNGATGDVETFEALIRWKHPVRGLVPPVEFIPFAEETGLIQEIGSWVVDTACAAAAGWPQPWRVSVNVSPAQFRKSDVCAVVSAALARHGLAPNRLVIEITEGVLIEDAPKAVDTLLRLRALGVRLALDDFGTGYSSLSYLQLFKFDKFKIDKSFVRKLGESDDALTITKTIVNLGHNLGLQVTAEGVETPQQLAVLQALGCDQIQGYLVARPAPVDTFSAGDRARARAMFQATPVPLSA